MQNINDTFAIDLSSLNETLTNSGFSNFRITCASNPKGISTQTESNTSEILYGDSYQEVFSTFKKFLQTHYTQFYESISSISPNSLVSLSSNPLLIMDLTEGFFSLSSFASLGYYPYLTKIKNKDSYVWALIWKAGSLTTSLYSYIKTSSIHSHFHNAKEIFSSSANFGLYKQNAYEFVSLGDKAIPYRDLYRSFGANGGFLAEKIENFIVLLKPFLGFTNSVGFFTSLSLKHTSDHSMDPNTYVTPKKKGVLKNQSNFDCSLIDCFHKTLFEENYPYDSFYSPLKHITIEEWKEIQKQKPHVYTIQRISSNPIEYKIVPIDIPILQSDEHSFFVIGKTLLDKRPIDFTTIHNQNVSVFAICKEETFNLGVSNRLPSDHPSFEQFQMIRDFLSLKFDPKIIRHEQITENEIFKNINFLSDDNLKHLTFKRIVKTSPLYNPYLVAMKVYGTIKRSYLHEQSKEQELNAQLSSMKQEKELIEKNIQQLKERIQKEEKELEKVKINVEKQKNVVISWKEKSEKFYSEADSKFIPLQTYEEKYKKISTFGEVAKIASTFNMALVDISYTLDGKIYLLSENPELASNLEANIQEINMITLNPSRIEVGKCINQFKGIVYAGPYKIKIRNPAVTDPLEVLRISLLHSNSLFGMEQTEYKLHPHTGPLSLSSFSFKNEVGVCLGEALVGLSNAFANQNFTTLFTCISNWLTNTNPVDGWGRTWYWFPKECSFESSFKPTPVDEVWVKKSGPTNLLVYTLKYSGLGTKIYTTYGSAKHKTNYSYDFSSPRSQREINTKVTQALNQIESLRQEYIQKKCILLTPQQVEDLGNGTLPISTFNEVSSQTKSEELAPAFT